MWINFFEVLSEFEDFIGFFLSRPRSSYAPSSRMSWEMYVVDGSDVIAFFVRSEGAEGIRHTEEANK